MLFFDLDGTLHNVSKYPVYDELEDNIFKYVARHVGMSFDDAKMLSQEFQDFFGSTVAGLMVEHGIDPDHFLQDVYQVDFSSVSEDKNLSYLLCKNKERKFVFTNATRTYTKKLLYEIGILDFFEDIFDIYDCNYTSKPQPEAFQKLFKKFGVIAPEKTTLVDDRVNNLMAASQVGMNTILCSENASSDWPTKYQNIYSLLEGINKNVY